jgi:NitT/TauT family transport system substrate-binding protein
MTPDIMFRYLAQRNGLDPDKDMELDYSFPTHIELANAVSAGIVKIGVISEPLVSLVMKKNNKVFPILDFNEEWNKSFGEEVPFAQTALVVKKSYAEAHPTIVNSYLKKLHESIDWVNENPKEAAKLIVKYKILPDEKLAMDAIPLSNLKFMPVWEVREGINEYFKVFYNFSPLILGGKLPDEKFYYESRNN